MGVEIAHMAASLMTTPGSFVAIIETGGHFLHLEEPKFVNQTILKFLT